MDNAAKHMWGGHELQIAVDDRGCAERHREKESVWKHIFLISKEEPCQANAPLGRLKDERYYELVTLNPVDTDMSSMTEAELAGTRASKEKIGRTCREQGCDQRRQSNGG